jgi:hypothetical protein
MTSTSYVTEKLSKLRSFEGSDAGLRTVFPVVFPTENCAVQSGKPTVSLVYLPTPWWHHLKSLNRAEKKTDKLNGKPVLCQRIFSSVFRAVFFTQLSCADKLRVFWGPLQKYFVDESNFVCRSPDVKNNNLQKTIHGPAPRPCRGSKKLMLMIRSYPNYNFYTFSRNWEHIIGEWRG